MRRLVDVLTLAAALALAGCGSAPSSAEEFSGEERAVAQVVEDIQAAGRSRDGAAICSRLLARELVDSIRAGGSGCAEELEASLEDADEFELEVTDVTVSGSTATAKVEGRDGARDRVATFRFVKEGGRWKATAIS